MTITASTRCIVTCEVCGSNQRRVLAPALVCAKCGGPVEVYVPLALVQRPIDYFVGDLREALRDAC